MTLEEIRLNVLEILKDAEVEDKASFAKFFNRTIRKINMHMSSKFPTVALDYSDEETYNYFPSRYIHTVTSGILYDLILSDEGEPDIYRTYLGEFQNGILHMQKNLMIDPRYQTTDGSLQKGYMYSGLTEINYDSPKMFYPLIPFFKNYDLTQDYTNGVLKPEDLLVLSVEPSLWKYLNNIEINDDLKVINSKVETSIPAVINDRNYQVSYILSLAYDGIVFKQHQDQINVLLFKQDTPKSIFDLVWKVM